MIIDLSVTNVDRVFQYRIPPELLGRVRVGVRVLAPFGRGDTLRKGYVVSLSHTPSFAPEKLKALREVDPRAVSVQEQMICLAWWMKERYGATMNQALKTVMPVKSAVAPKEEKTIVALRSREELSGLLREAEKKKYKARIRLYKALLENGELPYRLTAQKLGVTAASLRPLEEKGILKIRTEEKSRDPVKGYAPAAAPVVLNEDQKRRPPWMRGRPGRGSFTGSQAAERQRCTWS